MPSLQIRDLNESVYRRLLSQAQKERRSMAKQAAAILEENLTATTDRKEIRRALLDRVEREMPIWPDALLNPAELLREDRER